MKKIILMMAVLVSASAAADPADVNLTKASFHADFNKMIDSNNNVKKDIQKHIDQSLVDVYAEEDPDRSRVLDLVDLEVGWVNGAPNQIVDRRFNSIADPQPIDLRALVPNFVN